MYLQDILVLLHVGPFNYHLPFSDVFMGKSLNLRFLLKFKLRLIEDLEYIERGENTNVHKQEIVWNFPTHLVSVIIDPII